MIETRAKPRRKLSKYLLIAVGIIIAIKLAVMGLIASGEVEFKMPSPPPQSASNG